MPSYSEQIERFEGYNAQVVGISIDHKPASSTWVQSLGGLEYPVLSDFWPHGEVSQRYGVLRKEGFSERAVFIVDQEGHVRYIDVHDIKEQPDEEQIFEELRKLA